MNTGRNFYLAVATCIAILLLLALVWYQRTKDNNEPAIPVRLLQVADPVIDSPIQPIVYQNNLKKELVELGEMLFHDPRLSSTNNISCASCHDLNRGGVDRLSNSIGVNGGIGRINSPTIFNVSLNIAQFWDGRADTLDEQIDGPIHDPVEMGTDWARIIEKIESDKTYSTKFNTLYSDGITISNLKNAISTFESSLLTTNSPFDRYLQGDLNAISDDAKSGYAKFMEYGCVACHQGRNVGGNMYQALGIMGDYFTDRGTGIDSADLGRFNVTGLEKDRYVFRVPSLRLASLTAPYFHDGSAATLKDAVRIMIKYQVGRTASEQDEDLIIEFIKSLVGEYKGERLAP